MTITHNISNKDIEINIVQLFLMDYEPSLVVEDRATTTLAVAFTSKDRIIISAIEANHGILDDAPKLWR